MKKWEGKREKGRGRGRRRKEREREGGDKQKEAYPIFVLCFGLSIKHRSEKAAKRLCRKHRIQKV